jgi:hypothetical protein
MPAGWLGRRLSCLSSPWHRWANVYFSSAITGDGPISISSVQGNRSALLPFTCMNEKLNWLLAGLAQRRGPPKGFVFISRRLRITLHIVTSALWRADCTNAKQYWESYSRYPSLGFIKSSPMCLKTHFRIASYNTSRKARLGLLNVSDEPQQSLRTQTYIRLHVSL